MALENGTYINSLNANNPAVTDQIDQGDDHIRLIKSTIKATFPNLTGAVTLTQSEINALETRMDTAETNLSILDAAIVSNDSDIATLDTGKANIAGDTFTGAVTMNSDLTVQGTTSLATATATTPASDDDSTNIATTAWVNDQVGSLDPLPVGMVSPFAGTSAPTGWLLCDGSAVSRTTYAGLFSVIATTYGVGDGSTTFNLPDLRGRVPAGQDDMGGTDAARIGFKIDAATTVATGQLNNTQFTVSDATGIAVGMYVQHASGTIPSGTTVTNVSGTTITLSQTSTTQSGDAIEFGWDGAFLGSSGGSTEHTLTSAESGLPAHTHSGSFSTYYYNSEGASGSWMEEQSGNRGNSAGGFSVSVSANAAQDASSAHNNMQPTLVLNYIVKH